MIADYFDSIELSDMDQVKLMHRTDRKYWFHIDRLRELLASIKESYYILNIDGKTVQTYASTYYDTDNNIMFSQHHNGKLNRYKIRRRSYLNSGISFLEIKIKSNKGKTRKRRIQTDFEQNEFTPYELEFIGNIIPFEYTDLHPALYNEFSRITLVNKNFRERCTIDLELKFHMDGKIVPVSNMVIVEIKSSGREPASPLVIALRDLRIQSKGFSKYCVGRTLTDPDLKRNRFKGKIRSINKVLQKTEEFISLN